MNIESLGHTATMPAQTSKLRPDPHIEPGIEPVKHAAKTAEPGVDASRQALNKAILTTSLEVSLSAGNNSMSLLYKSAIEHINEVLAPELGENAIENAYKSGLDVSPQATADRIVSLSTAFFSQYAESHPDKDLETALKDFTALIGGGIEQGFSEARHILDGLNVLEGDIASNIDKTYELVQTGLKSFLDNYPRPDRIKESTTESAAA